MLCLMLVALANKPFVRKELLLLNVLSKESMVFFDAKSHYTLCFPVCNFVFCFVFLLFCLFNYDVENLFVLHSYCKHAIIMLSNNINYQIIPLKYYNLSNKISVSVAKSVFKSIDRLMTKCEENLKSSPTYDFHKSS